MAKIKLNARDYLKKLNEALGQAHPQVAMAPFLAIGSGSGYMWPVGAEGEALVAYQQAAEHVAAEYEYDLALD
jgi:hypothetical protein